MSEWVTQPLRDRTVNHDRRRIPVTGKDRRPGSFPYYGASGVVDWVDDFIFEGPHLLVAEDGENLRSRKTPIAFLVDGQFWVNNHAHVLQANPANDLRYLAYALESSDLSAYITGSTQPKLSQSALNQIPISAPDLAEQTAIADTLTAFDDKIKSNRRIAEKSQELLDTLSSRAVESFASRPLGELAKLSKATANPAAMGDSLVDHFSLPAFDLGCLPERVEASRIRSNKLSLDSTAILVSRLNPKTNRTWWAVPQGDAAALASMEFAALLPKPGVTLAALWLAVRDERFREEIARRVTGTSGSHQRIRPDDLLSVEVPDVSQLDGSTVALAATLLRLIEARRRETQMLVATRDSLLPELLSGRIRVPGEAAA